MSSKYAKLKNKLPAFVPEVTFQMKVDNWKATYGETLPEAGGYNVAHMAANFAELRRHKDRLEDQISQLNIALEALSQMGVERMMADDMEKIGLSDGSTAYVSYEVYPSVKDKALLNAWIKKHKLSDSMTLPWTTLKGICNELTINGKPLPEGVECFMKTALRVRNGNSSDDK